jgi:hypothetical protein
MALKDTYKEVEDEKKNKVKEDEVYTMDLDDFISEHKKLIKILRGGVRADLLAEAKSQEAELKECLDEHGMEGDNDEDEND